jgi:hypothetical protein
MRKTLTTAALLLALSCPTFAGEMHTGSPAPLAGEIPNPPAPQAPADGTTLNGEMATPVIMHNPGEIQTPGLSDILTETALDLLAVLPALL